MGFWLQGRKKKTNADTLGNLLLPSQLDKPGVPVPGFLQIFARRRVGADWLDVQRSNGRDFPLQPHFGVNRIGVWLPSATTGITNLGLPLTNVGTVSHPAPSSTNLLDSMRRWRLTSAATAGSPSENRSSVLAVWRGNAEGLGGFTLTFRLAIVTSVADARVAMGLFNTGSAIAGTINYQTMTQCAFFGYNVGTDANWQVCTNDASGNVSKIDTGFPITTGIPYTFYIYSPVFGQSMFFRMVNENTGAVFEVEVANDIPTPTQFLSPHLNMNNNATASAIAFDCAGLYLESDY